MNIEKIRKFLDDNKNTIKSLADISNIIQAIVSGFTIWGIVFVGLQYRAQIKTNREAKAFELYQHFNANNFMEIRNELKENFYEKILANPVEDLSIEDYKKAMEPFWEDKDNYVTIISLTNFLEQVATCVEQELCDEQATIALFGTEAKDFFETHYQFFDLHRNENGNIKIGEKLETFVREYRKRLKNVTISKTHN